MHAPRSACFTFSGIVALCPILWAHGAEPALGLSSAQSHQTSRNLHQQEHEWEMDQRTYPLGHIPHDARARGLAKIGASATGTIKTPSIPAGSWVNIGPAPFLNKQIAPLEPTSGRVTTIAVDPTNNAHWLIGGAMGGVWETRDTGVTWSPKTDDQASLAIGALAFAPGNPAIIYAGTGEPNYGAQDDYYGAGLLKSTDGGTTWQLLGATNFSGLSFAQIVVNPTNANVLVAALTGGGAGRGNEGPPAHRTAGIFKSTDGGITWTNKVSGFSTDVKADPSNFNHLLATIQGGYIGATYSFAQSTDAGETWNIFVLVPWSLGTPGRMQLAISPSNPNTA